MSVDAMNWAMQADVNNPTAKLVLLTLAHHHNNETGRCFPSIPRLMEVTELCRSSVFRSIRYLEEREMIERVNTLGQSTQYNLALEFSFRVERTASYKKAKIPQSLRTQVLERDAYRCVICDSHKELACDHIIPEVKGGATTLDNLQTMCKPCNFSKGSGSDTRTIKTRCQKDTKIGHSETKVGHSDTLKGSKSKRTSSPRAQQLSADWIPTPKLLEWAKERAPHVDTATETEKFINYFLDGPARPSWDGSWRNWIIRAVRDYDPKTKRHTTRMDGQRSRNNQLIDEALARRKQGADDPRADGAPRLRLITSGTTLT